MVKEAILHTLSPTALHTGRPILPADIRTAIQAHNYAVANVTHNVCQFYGRTGVTAERAYIRSTGFATIWQQQVWIPRHTQAVEISCLLQPTGAGTQVECLVSLFSGSGVTNVFTRFTGASQPAPQIATDPPVGWVSLGISGSILQGSSSTSWVERVAIRTLPIAPANIPDPPFE